MSTSRLLGCAVALLLCTAPAAVWAQDNSSPFAYAGPDQLVSGGAFVTLDGTQSYDQDGDPITLLWEQVSGDPVTLSETIYSATYDDFTHVWTWIPGLPKPTFTAPSTPQDLWFKLTVTDDCTIGPDPNNCTGHFFPSDLVKVTISAVPEPAAVWMFGCGILALLGIARFRKLRT